MKELKDMRLRQVNEEVFFFDGQIVKVGEQHIKFLKENADRNRRKRARLCIHKSISDPLHEMLIIHTKDTYVRPHKHLEKSESFYIIEGSVDVVVFDEAGKIIEVMRMGDYSSGKEFYYRISDPSYHTLLIRSEFLVFHETTKGPFKKSDTVFAPWAPDENDNTAVKDFMEQLEVAVDNFLIKGQDE